MDIRNNIGRIQFQGATQIKHALLGAVKAAKKMDEPAYVRGELEAECKAKIDAYLDMIAMDEDFLDIVRGKKSIDFSDIRKLIPENVFKAGEIFERLTSRIGLALRENPNAQHRGGVAGLIRELFYERNIL